MIKLLLAGLLFTLGCNENYFFDADTRPKLSYKACGTGYEIRRGTCVRSSDQCIIGYIDSDDSCTLLPCNNNLYFDGKYCIESASAFNLQDPPAPPPIAAFVDLCEKADWTSDQKFTNSGLIYLGLKSEGLLTADNLTLDATTSTCAYARSYIFDANTTEVIFPFTGITDLTPLTAFEYATNVEDLIIEVSRSTVMACPLTNTSVCKFVPFTK